MKRKEQILENYLEVLHYLKRRFPMYHLSNFFFRDVQYGIQLMFQERGIHVSYAEAEREARALVEKLEREKIFLPIDHQTWMVRYPEFRTPPVVKAAPAKPAPPSPGAPSRAPVTKTESPATAEGKA
jgi:hypothetical protein